MEKINSYRKNVSKVSEIELKQDLIVPDVKQDIFQILDSNSYCYLNKVEVSNGKVKVNGNVDFYLSYLSSSEETAALQTNFNFEDFFENKLITEKSKVKYNIIPVKSDIKIVNERKISITLNLKVNYDVYGSNSVEIFDNFDEMEDLELNSNKIKINSLIGINSNVASIKEDLKVESSDIISDILKVDTEILNKEVKISYNKVLTKADLNVKILYLTKDGRIGKVKEKIPLMSFIDIENIKEENLCSTDYQERNILLNINNGEDNSITIQMEYEIICEVFESKEQKIVSDLYSLKYDVDFTSKEIEIEDNNQEKNEKNIDLDEKVEIENIKNIIDVFGNCRYIKDNEGEVNLTIYFESENKIGLNVKKLNIPVILNDVDSSCLLGLENLEFDLKGKNIIIRGKINIKRNDDKRKTIKLVQDITKNQVSNIDNYSMVVYSIKKDDKLWDVAKKFKVKKENIINSNNLEEPYFLNPGEKLYIVR